MCVRRFSSVPSWKRTRARTSRLLFCGSRTYSTSIARTACSISETIAASVSPASADAMCARSTPFFPSGPESAAGSASFSHLSTAGDDVARATPSFRPPRLRKKKNTTRATATRMRIRMGVSVAHMTPKTSASGQLQIEDRVGELVGIERLRRGSGAVAHEHDHGALRALLRLLELHVHFATMSELAQKRVFSLHVRAAAISAYGE